jgi:hypothetical protein
MSDPVMPSPVITAQHLAIVANTVLINKKFHSAEPFALLLTIFLEKSSESLCKILTKIEIIWRSRVAAAAEPLRL